MVLELATVVAIEERDYRDDAQTCRVPLVFLRHRQPSTGRTEDRVIGTRGGGRLRRSVVRVQHPRKVQIREVDTLDLVAPHLQASPHHIRADRVRLSNDLLGPLGRDRSEEHTSELQSRGHLVCRLLLEKKKKKSVSNQ